MRCGFVTLLGRPNVGKSSIINALIGEKVAAVSPKPQTTRSAVRCILTDKDAQIVFVDTPGVHRPNTALGEVMMNDVAESLYGIDVICYVVEAGDLKLKDKDEMIISALSDMRVPIILAVNKTDKFKAEDYYLKTAEIFKGLLNFSSIVPLSAKTGFNVRALFDEIVELLPEHEPLYPEEVVMDSTEKFLASEIILEKIFLLTGQEVPHSSAVIIDEFKSPEEYSNRKNLKIRATIIVDRAGQKGIIIGKNGTKIREIGEAARKELEERFGYKVKLDLWVKVKPGWRKSMSELNRMGYGY